MELFSTPQHFYGLIPRQGVPREVEDFICYELKIKTMDTNGRGIFEHKVYRLMKDGRK